MSVWPGFQGQTENAYRSGEIGWHPDRLTHIISSIRRIYQGCGTMLNNAFADDSRGPRLSEMLMAGSFICIKNQTMNKYNQEFLKN